MDAVILSLYSKTIGQNSTRTNNIRKYSDTINWEDINFLPTSQDYAIFEKNNKNISLNVLEEDENERFKYIYRFTKFNSKNIIYLILLEKKNIICSLKINLQ